MSAISKTRPSGTRSASYDIRCWPACCVMHGFGYQTKTNAHCHPLLWLLQVDVSYSSKIQIIHKEEKIKDWSICCVKSLATIATNCKCFNIEKSTKKNGFLPTLLYTHGTPFSMVKRSSTDRGAAGGDARCQSFPWHAYSGVGLGGCPASSMFFVLFIKTRYFPQIFKLFWLIVSAFFTCFEIVAM